MKHLQTSCGLYTLISPPLHTIRYLKRLAKRMVNVCRTDTNLKIIFINSWRLVDSIFNIYFFDIEIFTSTVTFFEKSIIIISGLYRLQKKYQLLRTKRQGIRNQTAFQWCIIDPILFKKLLWITPRSEEWSLDLKKIFPDRQIGHVSGCFRQKLV